MLYFVKSEALVECVYCWKELLKQISWFIYFNSFQCFVNYLCAILVVVCHFRIICWNALCRCLPIWHPKFLPHPSPKWVNTVNCPFDVCWNILDSFSSSFHTFQDDAFRDYFKIGCPSWNQPNYWIFVGNLWNLPNHAKKSMKAIDRLVRYPGPSAAL